LDLSGGLIGIDKWLDAAKKKILAQLGKRIVFFPVPVARHPR